MSIIFQENCFSCYILPTDQLSLPHCLYFLRYWSIYVLKLFTKQIVTPYILRLNDQKYILKLNDFEAT